MIETNVDLCKDANRNSNEKSTGKRNYKQIYRKEWENNPLFKGWLASVTDDKYKAECTACGKELLAHRLTLLKHASSTKHLKKVALSKETSDQTIGVPLEVNCNDSGAQSKTGESSAILTDLQIVTVPQYCEHQAQNSDVPLTASDINHLSQIGATETVESIVTNLHESSNSQPMTGNLTNIIIQTEPFMDISDSPEALNFKQGYSIVKTDNCQANSKPNTDILSCTAAFLTEKMEETVESNVMNKVTTYTLQISTRVTDYSRAISVTNLSITLYKLSAGKWICVAESITDEAGRSNFLPKNEPYFSIGCYKMHYDIATYYDMQNLKSYFPFIEISFFIRSANETHHIPLMVSPNGYTAYRSLDF